MNIRFVVGLVLGLIFGLIATSPVNAQILWLGGVNDLNQLRIERSPGLSPIYSDSDPLETFNAKWSTANTPLFFIGENTDTVGGHGIVLEFSSGVAGLPIKTGYYSDTGWGGFDASLWLYVPTKYGDFGDMASYELWMKNSLFIVHEVEFTDQKLEKFAADFFVGGGDPDDTKWLRGEFRYNSLYPVTIGNVIPEPETYALGFGIGLIAFGVVRRLKK